MIEQNLEQIGLTKNEAKVYLALLDIGQTTTNKIIKKTKINTSKVYESLERLLRKGLVSYTIIKNKKNWIAENPVRVKDYLEEEKSKINKKEKIVDEILPELQQRRNITKKDSEYKIFEGIKGIKTVREEALNEMEKDDIFYLVLSTYPSSKTKLEAYFKEFHERRAKVGIRCKYILNQNLKDIEAIRYKIPLTDIRIVHTDALSPTWTEFYKDKVSIGVWADNPSIMQIKSEEVVKGFKQYFEGLWKQGKKPY